MGLYELAVLKFFHVMIAAAWFGAGMWAAGDARRTAALGPPHLGPLYARLKRIGFVAGPTGLLTILTGLGLIFAEGGFARTPHRLHLGLALAIVAMGVGIGLGVTSAKMEKLGENATAEQLRPFIKRMSALAGIFQLLWVTILLLMIVPLTL